MDTPQKKRLAEDLRDLLYEIEEPLDEIMELCRRVNYLEAYVPGNVWAERYGYIGKSGLDYLDEWIERQLHGDQQCRKCGARFSEDDVIDFFQVEGLEPDVMWERDMEGWCPKCLRKALV